MIMLIDQCSLNKAATYEMMTTLLDSIIVLLNYSIAEIYHKSF